MPIDEDLTPPEQWRELKKVLVGYMVRYGVEPSSCIYALFGVFAAGGAIFCLISPSTTLALTALSALPFVYVLGPEMREKEKMIWAAVSLVLILGVGRGLQKDERDNHNAQDRVAASFRQVGDGVTQAIQQNQAIMEQADATLRETRQVGKLAAENLQDVTGGDSYPYAVPQGQGPTFGLVLHNAGGNILSNISMTIARTQDTDWGNELLNPIMIGTIAGYGFAPVPRILSPVVEPKSGIDDFWIFIYAPNGMADEMLQFRHSTQNPNMFAYRFWVTKHYDFDRAGKRILGSQSVKRLMTRDWSDEAK